MAKTMHMCEVCGEPATHLTNDLRQIDREEISYYEYEIEGSHAYCDKHYVEPLIIKAKGG
ncbi:MAG: hypothetical protein SVK08_00685 [Halobacteriota archaeon]|nr:hypothetical protein [Halobacteriota archaeon]